MSKYVFGIDIGGTSVKLGLFTDDSQLVEKWEIPTNTSDNGNHILDDVAASIKLKITDKNIEKGNILGAGVGVPGPITENGVVNRCVNLGWDVFNVSEKLNSLLDIPVKVGNDATVAALGEMWQGGGKGYANVVLVTLGTGVGGGIVINGQIVYGTTGSAGEIGHIHIENTETEFCNCGNAGCLEQYASATGIVRMYNKLILSDDTPSILRDSETVSAKNIFDAAKAGDQLALILTDKYYQYLGLALSHIACVVDPEIFVIGGGVSKAGVIITEGIKNYYVRYAFHSCRKTKFALAELGNDAGIYGAAKLVL